VPTDALPTDLTDPPVVSTADELTAEEDAAADDIVGDLVPVAPGQATWLNGPAQPREGLTDPALPGRIRGSIPDYARRHATPAVTEALAGVEDALNVEAEVRAEFDQVP